MNNSIHLEISAFQAGIVAIPLKYQEGCKLNPQPTHLIVNNTFDNYRANFPDEKGVLKETACKNTALSLVYRKVIESGMGYRLEQLDFKPRGEFNFNQTIPKKLADLIDEGHEEMIENHEMINAVLPLLRFDGILSDFTFEYDVEESKKYLQLVKELKKPLIQETVVISPTVESFESNNQEI